MSCDSIKMISKHGPEEIYARWAMSCGNKTVAVSVIAHWKSFETSVWGLRCSKALGTEWPSRAVNLQKEAVVKSLARVPYEGIYRAKRTPAWSFLAIRSVLFMNKMRLHPLRSGLPHSDFQSSTVSSNRLTVWSSTRTWSKQLIGARNMIASTSWK